MINGFIFDMDGVILNTVDCHYQAWKKAFMKYNVALDRILYYEKVQVRGRKIAIQNMITDAPDHLIKEISNLKGRLYLDEVTKVKNLIYADALKFIVQIKRNGFPIAIASSSSSAKQLLHQLNLEHHFNVIISGNEVKNNKPSPDIFLKAAHQLGLPNENCIVFEDARKGIEAGLASHSKVIAVNRHNELPLIEGVLRYIKDFDALCLEALLKNS